MKRKKLLVIMLLLTLCLGMFGCGGSSDADSSKSAETTTEATTAKPEMTKSQENAYEAAKNYLSISAFSKEGLIEQLSSDAGDGYPKEDATFAVELLEKNKEVDWNEQAYKAAKNYLDISSFSKSGLIEQLESDAGDKFTHKQAEYGADKAYKE